MFRIRVSRFACCILHFTIACSAFAQPDDTLPSREEAALNAAAARVAPSVVQIRTIGGLDVVEDTPVADGPTTGLIVSPDGYIVSSAFNFAQKPSSILVTFASGKQAPAELVATDHSRMIVLLKATGVSELPVAELAPAGDVRVGQWAVAVGRTFRADRTNVTVGIVSALNRIYGKVIQTDADCSTTNYGGPLVDIRGRVLGLIVPMAPQATSEVAGTEWYDSGIGFAVPLAPLSERIEQMKKGADQRAGLMGIGMEPKNAHSAPAELATVRPDSPAGKAGLKKGDRIIELNGQPVRTQSDLRFALGPIYGGDKVRLVATRGEERLEREIQLVGELSAFRHAFLGILPLRPAIDDDAKKTDDATPAVSGEKKESPAGGNEDKPGDVPAAPAPSGDDSKVAATIAADTSASNHAGVLVRMVYDASPAAGAGIAAGDRITKIGESEIQSIDDAIQAMSNSAPENGVALELRRNGAPLHLSVTAGRLPTSVPAALPPADEKPAKRDPTAAPAGEITDLILPEFQHTCRMYVPNTTNTNRSLGVLLWLQSLGNTKPDDAIRPWQSICDRDGLVLAVPSPKATDHWERTDLEYLHGVLAQVISHYKVDAHRVVVGGQDEISSIAWLFGFADRNVVRGIATVSSPMPRQLKVPPNDPARRLAIYAAIPPKKDSAAAISAGLKGAVEAGYNVTAVTLATPVPTLSETERDDLARWIDTLDRF